MVTHTIFGGESTKSFAPRDATGSVLVAFLLFQVFLLRSALPVRVVAACVAAFGAARIASFRVMVIASVPVLVWAGLVTLGASLTGSGALEGVRLGVTLFAMVAAAIWFYRLVGPARIRACISTLAGRTRIPALGTLGEVMASFFEVLPEVESILRGALVAARVRAGNRPFRVRLPALRRALVLLASTPPRRARVLAVRGAGSYGRDGRLFGRFRYVLTGVGAIAIQEIARAALAR